jgi:hypothetical protein
MDLARDILTISGQKQSADGTGMPTFQKTFDFAFSSYSVHITCGGTAGYRSFPYQPW